MVVSRKQEIYREMLWWGIPYIRNTLAQGFWKKALDKSCYWEADFLHTLSVGILDEGFSDHDLFFLNNHARKFIEKSNPRISPNHDLYRRLVGELFTLVPDPLRSRLEWDGPPYAPPAASTVRPPNALRASKL